MGVLGFIKNKIDSAVNTVVELVTPQNAEKVQRTKKVQNIELVSKETQAKQKNEDKVEIKNNTKTIDKVYKQIEELCVEYKMDLKDVKKSQLLENIAGCSTEELLKKSDNEIKEYINSLKFVLKWQSWKMPWQNRGVDDIKNIAQKANERCTYLKTGGSYLGNTFRSKKPLGERMKKAGYQEVNVQNVKSYFSNMMTKAIESKDPKKIQKAYEKTREVFGYLLIDTKDPEEKALLTAAISELDANFRAIAADLSISSCQNNKLAKQKVARGLSDNFEDYTKADALGNRTSNEDNVNISQKSFSHMTEEDSLAVLDNMASRRRELLAKVQNGIPLSEDEYHYLNNAQCSQYAGAMVGASYNTTYSSPDNVISQIDRDTETFGIRKKVYTEAYQYIEKNQDSLPITISSFKKSVDKATNNNFSKTQESNSSKTQTSEKQNASSENVKHNPENETQTEQEHQPNNTTKTFVNNTSKSISTRKETFSSSKENIQTESNKKQEPKKTESNIQAQNTETPITKEKAIAQGVKAVKLYAKENNVSTFELAIESLSSSNLDKNTRTWALNEFESASASLQKVNFIKISNVSNAKAAAECMDKNDRENLKSRSFEIKQELENLNKKAQV